jgi:hypothetical protein
VGAKRQFPRRGIDAPLLSKPQGRSAARLVRSILARASLAPERSLHGSDHRPCRARPADWSLIAEDRSASGGRTGSASVTQSSALSGSTGRATLEVVAAPARPLAAHRKLPQRSPHRPPRNLAGGPRRHLSARHPHCATHVPPAPAPQSRPQSAERRSPPGRCTANAQVSVRFFLEVRSAVWSSRRPIRQLKRP